MWYSTNGVNWARATDGAPWAGRYGHTSVVHDGKIWVLGGYHGNTKYNDVWYSADGTSWTQAIANAPWAERSYHTSVVHDGKIWVIGGEGTFPPAFSTYKNDVWYSANGVNWSRATAAAPWAGRRSHSSVAYDGKIWVIGGGFGNPPFVYTFKNDVWYSSNGTSWTQATSVAPWCERYGHSSTVYNQRIWVIGGNDRTNRNDVWETGGEWYAAQIPAQSAGTRVEYYIEAEDYFSNVVTHPTGVPPGHQFQILDELTVSMPAEATAPAGSQVAIPVQIQQVSSLFALTGLDISYDPAVLRLPSRDHVGRGNLISDWSLNVDIPSSSTVRISAVGQYPVDSVTTTTLLNMYFDVIGDPSAKTNLVLDGGRFLSYLGEENAVLSNGSFQVASGTGDLNVTIQPQGAIDAGAQWRRTGTSKWLNSGEMENGLPTGSYPVEFKPLSAWDAPTSQSVEITNGATATASGTYVIKSYTVTFQTDGKPGATLTGTTPQTVAHGDDCTSVTAIAPEGYRFVKWTKGGADYSADNPLTVRNVIEDMTLTAVFAPSEPAAVKDWPLYE